ncbi:pyridoxamine 5'-phosphate oxidase family protein [Streptomyces boluensis]|uniref:Pyridoxamine 5'-phosphate oxidase family protein n=1 Tax=Streptomyces boluensis TaxID=1775135 RepID=A0A964UXA2_9ACTN|nr:pyridoxamine 5'-phosphate oxidase family protein [Streptomyces boluensis]NBE54542.1 pyridoxamine 5'-phosphate oxidase family protein [Streptomyces boluensis]
MSDESPRRTDLITGTPPSAESGPRRMVPLDRAEALRLLSGVSVGRIAFTEHALPAIRPVNHILDHGDIVIRTHEGAALTAQAHRADTGTGVVVAYEADAIDPRTHLGWSVVVTGYAQVVTDPADLSRYRSLLHPWVFGSTDFAIRIRPDLVHGALLGPVD